MSNEAKYTQDAKTHQQIKAYSSAVDDICRQLNKKPIETTRKDLVDFGVLWSRLPDALAALANKYAEYYWVKAWELYNDPEAAQKRCWISNKHLEFLLAHRWIGKAMSYFRKIQVDETEQFNAPTKVITPKLSIQAKMMVDQQIQWFKEADRLAALAAKENGDDNN